MATQCSVRNDIITGPITCNDGLFEAYHAFFTGSKDGGMFISKVGASVSIRECQFASMYSSANGACAFLENIDAVSLIQVSARDCLSLEPQTFRVIMASTGSLKTEFLSVSDIANEEHSRSSVFFREGTQTIKGYNSSQVSLTNYGTAFWVWARQPSSVICSLVTNTTAGYGTFSFSNGPGSWKMRQTIVCGNRAITNPWIVTNCCQLEIMKTKWRDNHPMSFQLFFSGVGSPDPSLFFHNNEVDVVPTDNMFATTMVIQDNHVTLADLTLADHCMSMTAAIHSHIHRLFFLIHFNYDIV